MTTERTYEDIQNALVKMCKSTGRYERGSAHEPTSAPGKGLTFAVFMSAETPILDSSLNSTSTVLVWTIQSRLPITYKPEDQIDLKLSGAARDLCRRIAGDFDLDIADVRSIDIRGRYGVPLAWKSGYLFQDSIWYRVFDVSVPVVINDAWPEEE